MNINPAEYPKIMTIPQAVPFVTAMLPGTTLAANLDDAHDVNRVQKIIYRYIASGVIPAIHIGRSVYLDRDKLSEWIANGGSAYDGGWRKNAKASA